jgi:hypothetical protein
MLLYFARERMAFNRISGICGLSWSALLIAVAGAARSAFR